MDEDDETQQTSVENYTGVAIKVRVAVMILLGPLILYGVDEPPSGRCHSTLKSTKDCGFSNSLGAKSPSSHSPQVRT